MKKHYSHKWQIDSYFELVISDFLVIHWMGEPDLQVTVVI